MVSSIFFVCLFFLFSLYIGHVTYGEENFGWQELTRVYLQVCTKNLFFTSPRLFVLFAHLCTGSARRGRVCAKDIIWFK